MGNCLVCEGEIFGSRISGGYWCCDDCIKSVVDCACRNRKRLHKIVLKKREKDRKKNEALLLKRIALGQRLIVRAERLELRAKKIREAEEKRNRIAEEKLERKKQLRNARLAKMRQKRILWESKRVDSFSKLMMII